MEINDYIPYIKNPFDSSLNAAKSSYRINELKELFSNISEKLNIMKNTINTLSCDNLIYSVIFKK